MKIGRIIEMYRMKQLKAKYTKDGIMRRNKLLLEHILVRNNDLTEYL